MSADQQNLTDSLIHFKNLQSTSSRHLLRGAPSPSTAI